jgi:hypothetical protein
MVQEFAALCFFREISQILEFVSSDKLPKNESASKR